VASFVQKIENSKKLFAPKIAFLCSPRFPSLLRLLELQARAIGPQMPEPLTHQAGASDTMLSQTPPAARATGRSTSHGHGPAMHGLRGPTGWGAKAVAAMLFAGTHMRACSCACVCMWKGGCGRQAAHTPKCSQTCMMFRVYLEHLQACLPCCGIVVQSKTMCDSIVMCVHISSYIDLSVHQYLHLYMHLHMCTQRASEFMFTHVHWHTHTCTRASPHAHSKNAHPYVHSETSTTARCVYIDMYVYIYIE